jgi:predicted amidohydrolase YtcJ
MDPSILAAALLLYHGNIYTLDPAQPRAEALVVAGGRIAYVGREAEARRLAGPDALSIDLEGRTALPGLIDAHGHLGALGALERGALDLRDAKSFDEVVEAVREEAARRKPGEWILGSRWDHESWPGRALPSHERISEAAPRNPVWLERVDGHLGLANRAAMDLAGIGRATEAPPGGIIERDAAGDPTGIFADNAIDLVAAKIPESARPRYEDLVLAAEERCFRAGLTSVHDAGVAPPEIETLKALAASGRLRLHVYAMVAASRGAEYVKTHPPLKNFGPRGQLTVRALKVISDGALGSRGAWLLAPYTDRPADEKGAPYVGLSTVSRAELEDNMKAAATHGYQIAVHAIGDAANRQVLDLLWPGLERPRIEHAQVVAPEDIPRFAEKGAIASMQPVHATSDMRWAERRLGKTRLCGAYAWASMLRAGARLALGSDFPVEAPDPLLGIYAAVTRKDKKGEPAGGWIPEERLTREEAVRGFTEWAAFAAFEEKERGTLAEGKRADIVVLSRDIFACEASEILTARVEMTIAGGEIVYRAKN